MATNHEKKLEWKCTERPSPASQGFEPTTFLLRSGKSANPFVPKVHTEIAKLKLVNKGFLEHDGFCSYLVCKTSLTLLALVKLTNSFTVAM